MPLYFPELKTQGRGPGLEPDWGWDLSIFLKNAVLGLGLGFVDTNPNPKTAFF